MLEHGIEQSTSSATPARRWENRHPKREDARRTALLHARVADNAPVVFERPERRRALALDRLAEPLGVGLDVDGSLGRDRSLLGDGGHDARDRLGVFAPRLPDRHRAE